MIDERLWWIGNCAFAMRGKSLTSLYVVTPLSCCPLRVKSARPALCKGGLHKSHLLSLTLQCHGVPVLRAKPATPYWWCWESGTGTCATISGTARILVSHHYPFDSWSHPTAHDRQVLQVFMLRLPCCPKRIAEKLDELVGKTMNLFAIVHYDAGIPSDRTSLSTTRLKCWCPISPLIHLPWFTIRLWVYQKFPLSTNTYLLIIL